MINRRAMLAGGALALAAASRVVARRGRAPEASFLPQGLPEASTIPPSGSAAGQKAADQTLLSSAQLRNAAFSFRVGIHAQQVLLRSLSPCGYSGRHRRREMETQQSAARVSRRPLEMTLIDLRSSFDAAEVAAVCQCSGNRRGFSEPHVPGVQWGLGAVGNALWKGAQLKDVLSRADARPNGRDSRQWRRRPVLDGTPDFIKSIPLDKALDDNTLIAYR